MQNESTNRSIQRPFDEIDVAILIEFRKLPPEDRKSLIDCLAAYVSQPEPKSVPLETYLEEWRAL